MSMFDKARDLLGHAVEEGKGRADDLRQRRERARTMSELGEACYRRAKGDAAAEAEIERLVACLDEFESEEAQAPDEIDLTASGQPSEPTSGEESASTV